MANRNDGSYWPYMILAFLFIGLTLGFWTIKSAINMPVSESNEYQLKYQQADMNINKILEAKAKFDKKYRIKPVDFKLSTFKDNKFVKRKHGPVYALSKTNTLVYKIESIDGTPVNDANVTFLLTRPQTQKDDQRFGGIHCPNGNCKIPEFKLTKAGRYILRIRAQIGDAIRYMDSEAYLQPDAK